MCSTCNSWSYKILSETYLAIHVMNLFPDITRSPNFVIFCLGLLYLHGCYVFGKYRIVSGNTRTQTSKVLTECDYIILYSYHCTLPGYEGCNLGCTLQYRYEVDIILNLTYNYNWFVLPTILLSSSLAFGMCFLQRFYAKYIFTLLVVSIVIG